MKTKKSYLKNIFPLISYVWKFSPELFVFRVIIILLQTTVQLMVYVSMIQVVIDAIAANKPFKTVAVYILICAAVQLLAILIQSIFSNYVNTIGKLKIHKGIHTLIFEKVSQIDLENYDDAEFYNNYIWALDKSDTEIINCYENLLKLFSCLLEFFSMLTVTLIYEKMLLLVALVPMLITFFSGQYNSKLQYAYEKEANVLKRRRDYSRRVFYLSEYAKELKLYDIGKVLLKNFRSAVEEAIGAYKKYGFSFIWVGVLQEGANTIFGMSLICLWMSYKAIVKHAYTAGTVAAMVNAVNGMTYSISQMISVFPKLQKNGMFAEKILWLLHYESKIETNASLKKMEGEMQNLVLKHVSFSYSGSEKKSLDDISFSLKKGEKIAIVGRNGAGKTTLVKLILRYYDTLHGEICYNGTNIREYTTKEYRSHFSTIFQDYKQYAVPLAENIAMCLKEKIDFTGVKEALAGAGLDDLSNQLGTVMTKEFDGDGLVLSGGQQQKIAIARALYRDGDVVILDEASSALDPISEYEINTRMLESLKEKCMIIISHRLSTIKHVDTIYFMENGKIEERGSHEELMALHGKYARMYEVQAREYRND